MIWNSGSLPQRIAASFIGSFGIVGLLLAAIGIYGAVSLNVLRRTREFGIRFALGARGAGVIRPMLRQGARLAIAGIVIGALLAGIVVRLIRSFLFGADASDWAAMAIAVIILLGAALAASWLPTRRAARVDPLEALRAE